MGYRGCEKSLTTSMAYIMSKFAKIGFKIHINWVNISKILIANKYKLLMLIGTYHNILQPTRL